MNPCILADDLSGALEAGAAFRARGWRVVLPLSEDADRGAENRESTLEVITTESRNLTPEGAAAAVRDAVRNARSSGMRPIFKKIDSTMRGPIGSELSAVLAEIQPPLTVFCPANPAAGRTVSDGRVLVDGRPLSETAFRNDPFWPSEHSQVSGILESRGIRPTTHLSIRELRQGRAGKVFEALLPVARDPVLVTADAEESDDLIALVLAGREAARDVLLVGSGGMAIALAECMGQPRQPVSELPRPAIKSLVVLCGSRHPASRNQLEFLENHARVRVLGHQVGATETDRTAEAVVQAVTEHGVCGVGFSIPPTSQPNSARLLAEVGVLAKAINDRCAVDAFFLTGGETAWSACRSLEGKKLEVLGEFGAGIVASNLQTGAGLPRLILSKPGGFGGEDAMAAVWMNR